MVVKNTSTYGAQLTSLGDGADSSFWRSNVAWYSGNSENTNTAITGSSTYTQIQKIQGSTVGTGVTGGFNNYLVMWTFGSGNSAPTSNTYLNLAFGYSTSDTSIGRFRVGYTTTSERGSWSGTYPINPGSIQPFDFYMYVNSEAGTFYASFAQMTIIGIN